MKKKISIVTIIPVIVIAVALLVFSSIAISISSSVFRMQEQNSSEKLGYVASSNLVSARSFIDTMMMQSELSSSALSKLGALPESDTRTIVRGVFNDMMDNPDIFSVYVAYEPNALSVSNTKGGSIYLFREDNKLVLDESETYDIYSKEDYYYITQQSRKPYLTEPYQFSVFGEVSDTWLITVSAPLLDKNDKLLGVINSDIALDSFANLELDNGGYKNAYSFIMNENGTLISHSKDSSLVGSTYTKPDILEESSSFETTDGMIPIYKAVDPVLGEESYIIYLPIKVRGLDQEWVSCFVVSSHDADKAANVIQRNIILISLAGLIVLAAVTILAINNRLRPIKGLLHFAQGLNNGVLTQRVKVSSGDELGQLAENFNDTAKTLESYVEEISRIVTELSHGELDVSAPTDFKGNFEPIALALKDIISALNQTFREITINADQVDKSAALFASGATELAQGISHQMTSISQISTEMNTISEKVAQNASGAENAAHMMTETTNEMEITRQKAMALEQATSAINQSTTSIMSVIKVIEDIAFQTNILALNASVEAARAGVAGKSFAVVADEVRMLAARCASAAAETAELIQASTTSFADGERLTSEMLKSYEGIMEKTSQVSAVVNSFSTASAEQVRTINHVNQNIQLISDVSANSSAMVEETAAASEELAAHATELHNLVGKFHVSDRR